MLAGLVSRLLFSAVPSPKVLMLYRAFHIAGFVRLSGLFYARSWGVAAGSTDQKRPASLMGPEFVYSYVDIS